MYEELLQKIDDEDIELIEMPLNGQLKGLYADKVIAIDNNIGTSTEKACILAEELGHYYTSCGDIIDQSEINNRKQELRAKRWAVDRMVTLEELVNAYRAGVSNKFELAEFLGISEKFLYMTIDHFKRTYGLYYEVGEYVISFEPLWVMKKLTSHQK